MEQAFAQLLQHGAVGAIAVLAILALAYVTRRYITSLEQVNARQAARDEQHVAALQSLSESMSQLGHECTALRAALESHDQGARERQRELLGELRILEGHAR